MNKYFLFLTAFLILSINLLSALNIGYVVNSPANKNSDEIALINFLTQEGHKVSVLDDVNFNAGVYDLVIVSATVSDIGDIFDHTNTKTIFMNNRAAQRKGLSSNFGLTSGRFAKIEKFHAVTKDFSLGDLQVYTIQDSLGYLTGCLPVNANILASKSDITKPLIIALESNALLIKSSCTNRTKKIYEKNLYFGLSEASNWNENAKKLFINSINWLTELRDADKDGFNITVDCNDDNPNIHPGANEIPYNGLDDDCSGGDLVDVDGDNYNSSLAGGNDCNDNDANINPGSTDKKNNCINDAPIIENFSPESTLNLLQNKDKTFSISYSDPDNKDNEVNVKWQINGQTVGFGTTYIFNRPVGDYSVIASVSDGLLSSQQVWSVNVKGLNFFSCSEVGGNICNSEQVCNGNILGVKDSSSCCSITCVEKEPEFSKANICLNKETKIDIDIIMNNLNEYKINSNIDFSARIKNNLGDNQNFNIDAYLYDITKDKIVDKNSNKLRVNKHEIQTADLLLKIKEDLNADDKYAVLVVARDDFCNQNYDKIDIVRNSHDVIIEDVSFSKEEIYCGYPLNLDVKLANLGTQNENVYVQIKNSKLKIEEKTESFSLDAFEGENDKIKKNFNFQIPEDTTAGDYVLRTEVYYDNKVAVSDETLIVRCDKKESSNENNLFNLAPNKDKLHLGSAFQEAFNNQEDGESNLFRIIFSIILVIFLGIAGFIVYNFGHN